MTPERRLLIMGEREGRWYCANEPRLPTENRFDKFYKESFENCGCTFIIQMQNILKQDEWRGWCFLYWPRHASRTKRFFSICNARRVVMGKVEGCVPELSDPKYLQTILAPLPRHSLKDNPPAYNKTAPHHEERAIRNERLTFRIRREFHERAELRFKRETAAFQIKKDAFQRDKSAFQTEKNNFRIDKAALQRQKVSFQREKDSFHAQQNFVQVEHATSGSEETWVD